MGSGFTCVLLTRGRVRCWGFPTRELDIGANVTVDAVFGSGVYCFESLSVLELGIGWQRRVGMDSAGIKMR